MQTIFAQQHLRRTLIANHELQNRSKDLIVDNNTKSKQVHTIQT